MKIAICHEDVQPSRGGCETYIAALARRLVADGHEAHLLARSWDSAALPEGLVCHKVSAPRRPRFLRPWFFGAACSRLLAEAGPGLLSVGFDKMLGTDVLYPQGGVYAAGAEHNLLKYPRSWQRLLARAARCLGPAHHSFLALERRQYRRPGPLVVAISDMVAGHLGRHYGLGPDELRVVRVACEPGRFDETDRPRRRAEWRRRWGLAPDWPVALFVGMNYRLKGLGPLLHALALLPGRPLRLVVAGKPDAGGHERLARRLGLADRVRFVGYCKDVRNGYFASDLLAHPTFYDPCSNVVLEALACGLPVVTSRHNGAAELLRPPREGYVVDDPHDHAGLAWCLEQLLDPARRQACARAARAAAAAWTFEDHYRALLDAFAEAAARKAAA